MSSGNGKRKIGLLTSGGDAPGMNAAIRAVVRTAVYNNVKVIGFRRGFEGLLSAEMEDMGAKSVSDIINRGGTKLLTARCPEMLTDEGKEKAAQVCKVMGLNALIVIGGDGSFRGAQALAERDINVFCIPGTIDLDLDCTEYTIGFDTAINTGMDAINKIRDTSTSHERCSVVEVMGRNVGHIALWCGMTGGAEEVVIAEKKDINIESVIMQIIENRSKGKTHNLILVSEGVGRSAEIAKEIQNVTGIQTRATILGHIQRGGSPTALDRMHAGMMGYTAVDLFLQGEKNRAIIYENGRYGHKDLNEALLVKKEYDDTLYRIVKILAI